MPVAFCSKAQSIDHLGDQIKEARRTQQHPVVGAARPIPRSLTGQELRPPPAVIDPVNVSKG
jgi:hypothetical protein